MPTLTLRTRPTLRMESLEDRCLWSVGLAQPDSVPVVAPGNVGVMHVGEMLQFDTTTVDIQYALTTPDLTILTWSDGAVSDGVAFYGADGILTIQTVRFIDPTRPYTVGFSLPIAGSPDQVTVSVSVAPFSSGVVPPVPVQPVASPPTGGLPSNGTAVDLNVVPVLTYPFQVLPTVPPNRRVNVVTSVPEPPGQADGQLLDLFGGSTGGNGVSVSQPAPEATPAPPAPPQLAPAPPPRVPVVITIRIEPPLGRPTAQSQYEAGTYRVDVQVSPTPNWHQPTADPQMFASPIRTLPAAPLLYVTTSPDVVKATIQQGQRSAKKSGDLVVANPPRADKATESLVMEPTEPWHVIPAGARQDVIAMDGVTLADAILSRFAAEALSPEPIAEPDVSRTSYYPFWRWLSFAALTSVAVRTWLVPSKRKLTDYQF